MFTGIVQELAEVVGASRDGGITRLRLALSPARREGLQTGASVAINGVCLTVADLGESAADFGAVGFDVIAETLARTNLAALENGDRVNVERSATFADEIGGHRVSGHVATTARVIRVEEAGRNRVVRFAVEPEWMRLLFHKGFVALDGASLTISALDRPSGWFEVSLIPETLARTTFGFRDVGDRVNLEVDAQTQAVVETVERLLADPDFNRGLGRRA